MEDEAIVFADMDLEEGLISRLRASDLEIDAKPVIGTALRIIALKDPKRFFGVVLDWWLDSRARNAAVTLRTSAGEVFALKDSTASEIRKKIERLP